MRGLSEDLCGLERGQGLAGTGGMPDIPELLAVFDPLNDRLHRVILIGTQYHQHLLAFIQHHILGNQLGQLALLQKHLGKLTELGNLLVALDRPKRRFA